MPALIDTHIHLDAPELVGEGFALLAGARQAGIDHFVVPGVRVSGWRPLLQQLELQPQVFAAPGLHPAYADQWSPAAAQQLRELCCHPQVVAIGEIGLDAQAEVDLAVQEDALRGQLEIASTAGLPVLIHCRRRSDAILRSLAEAGFDRGGIWHGFSGSIELARRIVAAGFVLGIGPVLLRDNVRKLPVALRELPAESLVLETDFPDMASGPATLVEVARRVADLRGWTLPDCARITTANARRVLRLQEFQ